MAEKSLKFSVRKAWSGGLDNYKVAMTVIIYYILYNYYDKGNS